MEMFTLSYDLTCVLNILSICLVYRDTMTLLMTFPLTPISPLATEKGRCLSSHSRMT